MSIAFAVVFSAQLVGLYPASEGRLTAMFDEDCDTPSLTAALFSFRDSKGAEAAPTGLVKQGASAILTFQGTNVFKGTLSFQGAGAYLPPFHDLPAETYRDLLSDELAALAKLGTSKHTGERWHQLASRCGQTDMGLEPCLQKHGQLYGKAALHMWPTPAPEVPAAIQAAMADPAFTHVGLGAPVDGYYPVLFLAPHVPARAALRNHNGDTVSNAVVSLGVADATTDAAGACSVRAVPDVESTILVNGHPSGQLTVQPPMEYEEQNIQADIRTTINVTVTDSEGKPIQGILVSVYEELSSQGSATSNPQGKVSLWYRTSSRDGNAKVVVSLLDTEHRYLKISGIQLDPGFQHSISPIMEPIVGSTFTFNVVAKDVKNSNLLPNIQVVVTSNAKQVCSGNTDANGGLKCLFKVDTVENAIKASLFDPAGVYQATSQEQTVDVSQNNVLTMSFGMTQLVPDAHTITVALSKRCQGERFQATLSSGSIANIILTAEFTGCEGKFTYLETNTQIQLQREYNVAVYPENKELDGVLGTLKLERYDWQISFQIIDACMVESIWPLKSGVVLLVFTRLIDMRSGSADSFSLSGSGRIPNYIQERRNQLMYLKFHTYDLKDAIVYKAGTEAVRGQNSAFGIERFSFPFYYLRKNETADAHEGQLMDLIAKDPYGKNLAKAGSKYQLLARLRADDMRIAGTASDNSAAYGHLNEYYDKFEVNAKEAVWSYISTPYQEVQNAFSALDIANVLRKCARCTHYSAGLAGDFWVFSAFRQTANIVFRVISKDGKGESGVEISVAGLKHRTDSNGQAAVELIYGSYTVSYAGYEVPLEVDDSKIGSHVALPLDGVVVKALDIRVTSVEDAALEGIAVRINSEENNKLCEGVTDSNGFVRCLLADQNQSVQLVVSDPRDQYAQKSMMVEKTASYVAVWLEKSAMTSFYVYITAENCRSSVIELLTTDGQLISREATNGCARYFSQGSWPLLKNSIDIVVRAKAYGYKTSTQQCRIENNFGSVYFTPDVDTDGEVTPIKCQHNGDALAKILIRVLFNGQEKCNALTNASGIAVCAVPPGAEIMISDPQYIYRAQKQTYGAVFEYKADMEMDMICSLRVLLSAAACPESAALSVVYEGEQLLRSDVLNGADCSVAIEASQGNPKCPCGNKFVTISLTAKGYTSLTWNTTLSTTHTVFDMELTPEKNKTPIFVICISSFAVGGVLIVLYFVIVHYRQKAMKKKQLAAKRYNPTAAWII